MFLSCSVDILSHENSQCYPFFPSPSCNARLLICICFMQQTLYTQRHSISIQTWALQWKWTLLPYMCTQHFIAGLSTAAKRSSAWLVPLLKDTRGDMNRNRHIGSCILFLAFCLLTGSCWPIQTVYMLLTKQVWLVYAASWKQSSAHLQ